MSSRSQRRKQLRCGFGDGGRQAGAWELHRRRTAGSGEGCRIRVDAVSSSRVSERAIPLVAVLAGLLLGIAFGAGAAIALHGGANKNCTNNNPCNGTNGPDDIFGTNDYNNINALEGADMGWAYDHGDHFDGAGGA